MVNEPNFSELRGNEVRTIRLPGRVTYVERHGIRYPELYEGGRLQEHLLHVAQKFELFLDTYRRPDGSRWTGQKLDEATGGVVPRSYVTNLRKGRIENP
jgi:hypothetical protein